MLEVFTDTVLSHVIYTCSPYFVIESLAMAVFLILLGSISALLPTYYKCSEYARCSCIPHLGLNLDVLLVVSRTYTNLMIVFYGRFYEKKNSSRERFGWIESEMSV